MKKIITFGHTKGGVGKSTLAWHTAHALLNTGKKVTLVDLDFQQTLFFVHALSENPKIEVLQPRSASELIEIFEESHGYLVVDVGGFDSDLNRIALRYSEKIVVPISNSITEIIGFKTYEAILEECEIKGSVNLLLNNIHPLTQNFDELLEATKTKLKHTSILKTVIRNNKMYKESMAQGKSVFDYKNEKCIKAIEDLKNELI
jgi:chromosome partitioning protein